jgi:hypothetical protein
MGCAESTRIGILICRTLLQKFILVRGPLLRRNEIMNIGCACAMSWAQPDAISIKSGLVIFCMVRSMVVGNPAFRFSIEQTINQARRFNHDVVSGWTATVNSKMAPPSTFALAHNLPPCALMIERQIKRPRPKPAGLVV